jgi:hypothetical protein
MKRIVISGTQQPFQGFICHNFSNARHPPPSQLHEEGAHDDLYRSADKSLARSSSRYSLFDGENISFDASLVTYINSTNIPPIMIINRIYETQNLLSL